MFCWRVHSGCYSDRFVYRWAAVTGEFPWCWINKVYLIPSRERQRNERAMREAHWGTAEKETFVFLSLSEYLNESPVKHESCLLFCFSHLLKKKKKWKSWIIYKWFKNTSWVSWFDVSGNKLWGFYSGFLRTGEASPGGHGQREWPAATTVGLLQNLSSFCRRRKV